MTAGYTYNCYYRLKADSSVPEIFPMLAFRNANNDELAGWVSAEPGYMHWVHAPPTSWKQYLIHGLYAESLTPTPLVRIVPPAGATKMTIWFGVAGTPWNGGSIYVDDVVVDKVPASASSAPDPSQARAPASYSVASAANMSTTQSVKALDRNSKFLEVPVDDIFKATAVRAKCFKTGFVSSPTVTHTYFVGPSAATRYTLPIVSLVTDRNNFFDPEIGIYVPGNYDNYNQRGDTWERPVHVEFFEAGGPCGFQCDAGIRPMEDGRETFRRRACVSMPTTRADRDHSTTSSSLTAISLTIGASSCETRESEMTPLRVTQESIHSSSFMSPGSGSAGAKSPEANTRRSCKPAATQT